MAIQSLQMPALSGVVAGNTALCKLPIGNKYHDLELTYSGVTLAQMTEIRVLANGKVFQRYSATDRDVMNQYDGNQAAAGVLYLPFDRQSMINHDGETETAINTGTADKQGRQISSLNVEIDIAAGAAGPALSLQGSVEPSDPGGPGTMLYIKKLTRSATGAGELQINDLPYGDPTTAVLNRFLMSTANLTSLEVKRGLVTIFKRTPTLNNFMQTHYGYRNPQANWFMFDPTERGYPGDVFNMVGIQDLNLICQMSAAEQMTIYGEYLGVLGT